MKKLRLWLIAMLTISLATTLTSCGDDKKEEPVLDLKSEIVGQWVVMQSFAEDIDKGEQFIFTSSGKVTWNGDEYFGKYTLKGNKLTIVFTDKDGDIEQMSGTITIDDDIMTYEFTWYWSYDDEYSYDNKMILRRLL